MELMVDNPNVSLIMPVGCNAKCDFCYWQKSSGITIERFKFIINTLPDFFKQISITGGEPTLDDNLQEYLKLAKQRFDKVVLNTNGFKLKKEHFDYVDFVNISRHHYNDSENSNIFRTNSIPDEIKLKELCSYGNVTINCFLEDGFSDEFFINNYIKFAKSIGANVAFRKNFNNLSKLPIDSDNTLISSHECPACLHRKHIINDVNVNFKYSVKETSEAINGIYELIIQSNGDLTFDWKGENKLIFKTEV
jgi:molybdenum cofactor biosynthesis enzyme MoaA